MKEDKYKDPVNDKILKDISEKIKEFRKNKPKDIQANIVDAYRIGCYAGMNIALRDLGREPL